jgi:hypothetical protein
MARFPLLACVLLSLPMALLAAERDRATARPRAASPEPTLRLPWSTLDGGGGPLQVGTRVLDASIGQPDANPAAALRAGTRELRPGYWTPAGDGSAASIFTDGFEND